VKTGSLFWSAYLLFTCFFDAVQCIYTIGWLLGSVVTSFLQLLDLVSGT